MRTLVLLCGNVTTNNTTKQDILLDIDGITVHVSDSSHMTGLGSNTFLPECAGDGMPLSTMQRAT